MRKKVGFHQFIVTLTKLLRLKHFLNTVLSKHSARYTGKKFKFPYNSIFNFLVNNIKKIQQFVPALLLTQHTNHCTNERHSFHTKAAPPIRNASRRVWARPQKRTIKCPTRDWRVCQETLSYFTAIDTPIYYKVIIRKGSCTATAIEISESSMEADG